MLGLGLIGGSLLRRLGDAAVGYDADPATRDAVRAAGANIAESVAGAVAGCDIAVAAVPLPAMAGVIRDVPARTLLTDVASVKAPVAALAGGRRYVGGHPMAGTERSGFAASDPALFDGAAWVLCLDGPSLADWLAVAALVTGLGARVVPTTTLVHDALVARVSHLPHVFAAVLATLADDPLALTLAAGSFRDATRVAASRPELTAAMCEANRGPLAEAIGDAVGRLTDASASLQAGRIGALFERAHGVRTAWPAVETERATLRADDPALRERLLDLGASGGWVSTVDGGVLQTALPRGR